MYTVTVTDALGCSNVFELQMVVPAFQADTDLRVAIFPNPCNDFLQLKLGTPVPENTLRVVLTDLTGMIVLSSTALSGPLNRVETAKLPSGMYVLQILRNGRPVWSARFVKS
jgi:hypothetical protein